jgi:2'-hydroxyisoflavone reductase
VGPFNAVGPKTKLTMGQMLTDMKKTINPKVRFTWVEDEFLKTQKIIDDIPIWTSPKGPEIGYLTTNSQKAIRHGLTFRPLSDTSKATLEWFHKQPQDRQSKLRAGIKPDREREVLQAWHINGQG